MKIANAQVSMQSQHAAVTRQETRESLRTWVGAKRPDFENEQRGKPQVQISAAGHAAQSAEAQAIESSADAVENDPMLSLIKSMVEMLTGHRIRVFDSSKIQHSTETTGLPAPARASTQDAPPPSAGFGIEYDYHAVREESEQTSFSAQGTVRTADGKEIQFQLDLSMARQYREQVDVSFRAGDAQKKDPLVINFDGNAAQLTDQRFRFDINADGMTEQLATLAPGSGYLALDKNGNGRIDSGAELFGPATGSGFGELAALDADKNNWIDENDPAYAQLRVWTPDSQGHASLETLKARQVGALYLGNISTPFALRGANNSDLGAVAATGVYLTESGKAGTVQEIDLSV
jgi:hypothetical protein